MSRQILGFNKKEMESFISFSYFRTNITTMRITIATLFILFSVALIGQNDENHLKPHVLKASAQIQGQYGERWYNQFSELSGFGLATPIASTSLYGMPIFPDSTIIVAETNEGEVIYNYIHAAATVINPFYTLDEWILPDGTVTVDSFALDYSYTRNLDSNIVDTLIVYYIESHDLVDYYDFNNSGSPNPGEFANQVLFSGTVGSLFPPSALIAQGQFAVRYDQWSQADTVLLTYEDSTTGGSIKRLYRDIDIQITPANGGRVGAFVEFRPGYTWTTSDTLFDKNYFEVVTAEQNGQSTAPVDYFSENFAGGSYVLRRQGLYNEYSGNLSYLNTQLEFTQAFSASWIYEHHFMWFKVSHPNVGLEDLEVGDFAVYPNPTVGILNIAFSEKDIFENRLIEVYSIEGKLIQTVNTNSSVVQLNTYDWTPGLYIVRSEGNSQTVVVK
jgi:hypothetical protein